MHRSHRYPSISRDAPASPRYSTELSSRPDAYDSGWHRKTLPTSPPGWGEAAETAHGIECEEWHGDGQFDELTGKAENLYTGKKFSHILSAEACIGSGYQGHHFEETAVHRETPLAFPDTTQHGHLQPSCQLGLRNDWSEPESPAKSPPGSSMNIPEVLTCVHGECAMVFTGRYRRGSLQRHMRLKHRSIEERLFPCEFEHCNMIFKRPDARLKHYRRRHANLSQMAPPKEREVHSNQKEIHEATIERWRSISAEHTGIGGDVGSRSNPAIHINVTKRVPNFLHPEYHKESEADGSISNDDPIYSTVTSQTSDPDEAGMWRTCDSDMDSGTEERVILKKEPEELGTLLNSIGKLHIQCWNNSTHYESHGDGAQDGHHTTTNQNYDIGQEGNNATASQSSAPFKCPIRRKFGEDEDEEDKKGKKRRVKHVPIAGEVMEGLLACPFPKRDPFSYSNCWTYATDNIPHLKQHLKRDHLTPVHCPNCGQLFTGLNSNSEKDRHFIQQTCVQDVTVPTRRQGITADQQKQIWRNKPRSMDDDQYWNYIYEVLFASEPPLHPRPEDYVNLGLQLLRQKVTKNFSGLLENRPERADFRLDDLHERTRQDSRSNTPSLPDLLDQAFDIAIVQRHTVTPLLSTFKGCSSGASTHASESGYASLDTNSAEEDSAPATGHTPQSRASDEAFYPTEDLSCHPEQYREFLEKANHAEGESSTTQVIDYDLYCKPCQHQQGLRRAS